MPTQILVVDDSVIEQRLVGRLLKKGLPDIAVSYAMDGQEALNAIAAVIPDLVISDLRMPVMNGLELVESIKARGYGVPVILMTSNGNEKIAVQTLQAGASSYVPKLAFDKNLISTITSVLSLSRRQLNRQRVLSSLDALESRFVLKSDTSLIAPVIAFLQEQLEALRLFDQLQMTQIGVAIHESLTNAIYHGNLELDSELRQEDETNFYRLADARRQDVRHSERRVRLVATMSINELRVVIRDDGPGFQPADIQSLTSDLNLDRIGGRGLLLIRSFMDEVSHNAQGNEITLVKRPAPRISEAASANVA